jgi:hypothetical protein
MRRSAAGTAPIQPTTARKIMTTSHFERVMQELGQIIGIADTGALCRGGRLRLDGHLVTFVHDDTHAAAGLCVYLDLGPAPCDQAHALKVLMQLNFGLGVGERGLLSLHPQTQHVFYSFRYPLSESAKGQALLDTLIRCVYDVALDAFPAR